MSVLRTGGLPGRGRGFTLTELMIVVAIAVIITAIAYPSYVNWAREARRADAYNALTTLAARQERFFADFNTYTNALTTAPLTNCNNAPGLGYPDNLSPDRHYTITINPPGAAPTWTAGSCRFTAGLANAYTLTATPVASSPQSADAACPNLTLDSTGAKGPAGCWGD